MASLAARYGYYLARGAVRKWGPWAAKKYGGRALGALGAAGAGYATKKYATGNKRKRVDSGVGGRPANDDTRINLNSTYNAVSLYSKRSRTGKMTSSKKRAVRSKRSFSKKVKQITDGHIPWSKWSVTYTNQLAITSAPATTYGSQDIFGANYSHAFQLCPGLENDAGIKDINHITTELNQWGHIQDGAIVNDNQRNTAGVAIKYRARMEFDIQCFNSEFTESNPLYIDIYECTAARNIHSISYATPADAWATAYTDNYQSFTGDSNPVNTRKGERPSDCHGFKKWWSVDKVTRVRITSPAPFHYDLRSSGTWTSHAEASLEDTYCLKGKTKGIMIVVAPIMVTTMPAAYNFQITAVNKHFDFKPLPYKGHTNVTQTIQSNLATTL